MKKLKVILVLSFLLQGIVLNRLFAQAAEHPTSEHPNNEHPHQDALTSATPKLATDQAVITGKVICLGCDLKNKEGAAAQCSIYGHKNALKIEKSYDAQGKSIDQVIGKTYQFLHNDNSDELINDHSYSGKRVIITGKTYPDVNLIEVGFFKKEKGE